MICLPPHHKLNCRFQKGKFVLLVHRCVNAFDVQLGAARVVQEDMGLCHAITRGRFQCDNPTRLPHTESALRLLLRYHVECAGPDHHVHFCRHYHSRCFADSFSETIIIDREEIAINSRCLFSQLECSDEFAIDGSPLENHKYSKCLHSWVS